MAKILSEEEMQKMTWQFGTEQDHFIKIMEASDIGAPAFVKNDISTVRYVLDKLLRYFFIKKRISINKFKMSVFAYCKYMGMGHPAYVGSSENTEYTNIKRTITTDSSKNGLTFLNFKKVVSNIFGYQIEDMCIKLRNVGTGEIVIVSLSEIDEYLKSDDYSFPEKRLRADNEQKQK